jgi:hypothetical protein
MCRGLHLNEWETRAGAFEGWSKDERHAWKAKRDAETNAAWDALSDEQREWWQERAALAKAQYREAMRGLE